MITIEKIRPAPNISRNLTASRKFDLFSMAIILILILIVYANSLENEFTNWDDQSLVVNNTAIRSLSLENVIDIFTPEAGLTFQPVRVLSYAVDYYFWKLNPTGYHIFNTLLHGLSAIILYLVLSAILNQVRGQNLVETNRIISLFAVLLFAVHPVNVEAVTWISSRKYVLLSFFYFLSLYLYIKSSEQRGCKVRYYFPSIVIYILALLSSPFGVTLPAILFLYDYSRDESNNPITILRKRLLYYVPFALLSITQFLVLQSVLSSGPDPTIKQYYLNNRIYTLFTMLRVLFDYIKNLLFPFWLNSRYMDRISFTLFEYKVITTLTISLMVAIFLLFQIRKGKKLILFCVGWFFITWLPVSNIIPISTTMADRYLYLPAVGMFLWFSLVSNHLVETWFSRRHRKIILVLLIVSLTSSFSYLSIQRNKVWSTSETLWEDSLSKTPNNRLALLNHGEALQHQGRLEEAIARYREALRIYPRFAEVHNNLGVALANQGRFDEAIDHYMEALRINRYFDRAHGNLGKALDQQGKIGEDDALPKGAYISHLSKANALNNLAVAFSHLKKFDEAIEKYNEVLRIMPDWAEGHNNLGNALASQGKIDEAITHYSEALRLKPDYAEAHNNLGVILAQQRKFDQATTHYLEALRLNPDSAAAHNNLASTLIELGKFDEAIAHLNKAVEIMPDYAEAYNTWGDALSRKGRLDEAASYFSKALQLNPNYAEAYNNLGVVLARQGKLDEAIIQFREAVRLKPNYMQARANLELALEETGRTTNIENSAQHQSL